MIRQALRITVTVWLGAMCRYPVLGQTPPASGAGWTPINAGLPNSTVGITALTIDPSKPSTLYAYSPRGGLFKSTDAAASWKAVSFSVGLSFLAIETAPPVFDPNNSLTLYAATQHGIVKSTDGGESWNAANGSLTDNCFGLTIAPITPTTVYGLCNGGIFKTTDGGETWKQSYAAVGSSVASSLVIDPTAPSTIYAGVNNAEIIKSTDSGENWVTIKTGLPFPVFNTSGALVIDPRTPSTLYAGSFAASSVSTSPGVPPLDYGTGSISRSTDGGQTWITVRTGIPSDAFVESLAIDPVSPSTIYAGYSGSSVGGILKSTDGGQSWSVINTGGFPGGFPRVIAAVDPQTPSTIYAAYYALNGTGIISKSTDAGSSWQSSNEGLAYYDLRALAIDPMRPTPVYAGGAGGVFKTDDAGGNWINLATFQVSSGYTIGAGPTDVRSLLINFKNPNILYAETVRANGCAMDEKAVFKSIDGGATWSDSISPEASGCLLGYLANSTLIAMDPTDPDTLYLSEADDEDGFYALLKSTDGGASWNSIWNGIWSDASGLHCDVNTLAIDPVTPTTLYAGLCAGVFKSTDGGASWNLTALNTFVTVLSIDRTSPSILYAGGSGGLFKSTDGGASWVAINRGLTDLAGEVTSIAIAPNDSNVVYAATSGGIYKSVDGGRNWITFDVGLTNLSIQALAIAPGTPTTLYAATPGGVFTAIDAPAVPEAVWQEAITAVIAAAGTDSLNFFQWAWYWQTTPAFVGAPSGFGAGFGSISASAMDQTTMAGGGNPLLSVSAEQWVSYFRQIVPR